MLGKTKVTVFTLQYKLSFTLVLLGVNIRIKFVNFAFQGLCGTFNYNQEDDLLTPEGDVEKSIIAFINKWKSDEKCETLKTFERSEACEIFIQNKPIAESYCKNLTSDVFKG